jgi:hypothetical protein
METTDLQENLTPAQSISNQIAELADWRGATLSQLRELIHVTAPGLTEGWKWGTGVWSQKSNVLSVGVFKDHVKLTFFKGVALDDPEILFNAGQDAKAMRSIDFKQGDELREASLKALIDAAAAYDLAGGTKK